MIIRDIFLSSLYGPLMRRTAEIFVIKTRNRRSKKRLIIKFYEIGIFTAGDVERLFAENNLKYKED